VNIEAVTPTRALRIFAPPDRTEAEFRAKAVTVDHLRRHVNLVTVHTAHLDRNGRGPAWVIVIRDQGLNDRMNAAGAARDQAIRNGIKSRRGRFKFAYREV